MNGKRLLVIEDEDNLLKALATALNKADYEVITAKDGEEGLQALTKDTDLIILDLVMPKVGGIELLEEIRGEEEYKNMPVLVLTNWTNEEAEKRAKELKVSDYLIKSDTDIETILEEIERIIS